MQSSSQRRWLLETLNIEPVQASLTLAKCAAGLAVIVLIAVIGATDRGDRGAVSHVAAGTPASVQPAQQHRKQVFDGRRARFQGYAERRSVAGATKMPENHSRVVLR